MNTLNICSGAEKIHTSENATFPCIKGVRVDGWGGYWGVSLNIFIRINSTYIHTILTISDGIQKEATRLIRICFPI